MNQENKENGLVESEKKEYVFSWRRLCIWIALVLSTALPIPAIGLGMICISSATEEEKKEVSIVSYIAIAVAVFLLVNQYVLEIFS